MLARTSVRGASMLRSLLSAPVRRFGAEVPLSECKKTALFDVHTAAGGKIVPFCGYALPVQYADGLNQSHAHVRNSAGLFDVSHMGQVKVTGEKRVAFLETICVTDVAATKPGVAKLSVLTNEQGGVIDDFMLCPRDDHVFMVLNAGCKDKDMAHIRAQMAKYNAANPSATPVALEYLDKRSLVALQGPKAAGIMQKLLPGVDLAQMAFMTSTSDVIEGIKVDVTRCGYTGEDGFEVGCANEDAVKLWSVLTSFPEVLPAGLGVRDSLRLEAGLCLYGHELDEQTTPVEAGLTWVISPRRRREGGFLGAETILKQLAEGPAKKLVGIEVKAGAPARQGSLVLDPAGNQIGVVTSGGPAPSLNMKKIAIAYVKSAFADAGKEVQVSTRGKATAAEVVKMPFVTANYYRVPKVAAAKQ